MSVKTRSLQILSGVSAGMAFAIAPMIASAATFGSGAKIPTSAGDSVLSAGGSYLLQPVVDYLWGAPAVMQMLFAFLALAVVFVVVIFMWRAIKGWFNRHKR